MIDSIGQTPLDIIISPLAPITVASPLYNVCMAKWKEKSAYTTHLDEIERSVQVKNDGSVGFSGLRHWANVALLHSMLDFSDKLSEAESRKIVWQALRTVRSKGSLEPKAILTEVSKQENLHLSLPFNRYVLVSSLSIQKTIQLPKIKINDSIVIFESELPKKYRSEANKFESLSSATIGKVPSNYIFVRVHLSERSPQAAMNKAQATINLLRGMWNWLLNYKRQRISIGHPKPINTILKGPIQTLHHLGGKLAIDNFYYELNYVSPISPDNLARDVDKFLGASQSLKRTLSKNPMKADLEKVFIRYANALDQRDLHSAFLQLWGILEYLTHTTGGRYDDTIRRVSFLYTDNEYHKSILNLLRNFRNNHVHYAFESDDVESFLIELKHYVDHLIEFYLGNPFKFNSIQDMARFLHLPPNRKDRKINMEFLKKAAKFRDST